MPTVEYMTEFVVCELNYRAWRTDSDAELSP